MELISDSHDGLQASILVLSGWRGIGKTTFCRKLVDLARLQQIDVAGLLSPGRFAISHDPGNLAIKTGIDVEDLRTGERRLLATNQGDDLHGPRVGSWMFSPEVFAWADGVIRSATPCDLLIIDELGPLEFDRRQGWYHAFELLDQHNYRLAVPVIRPEYLDRFIKEHPEAGQITLTVAAEFQTLAEQVLKRANISQYNPLNPPNHRSLSS